LLGPLGAAATTGLPHSVRGVKITRVATNCGAFKLL